MIKKKNILVFAREAGGAAAVAPVCHAMIKEGWSVLLLAKDHGLGVFQKHGLDCIDFPVFDVDRLRVLLGERFNKLPDIIFTSATSLPSIDMTERYLWRWGQDNDIPTVGIVDQWQNYTLRFSGPSKDEHLAYLPDRIFVMDKLAKRDMIREKISANKIIVTGQPAFDKIKSQCSILSSDTEQLRRRLNIASGAIVVLFIAESLSKDFGNSLGYNEQSTLRFLGTALEKISMEKRINVELLIKLHSENNYDEFKWALSLWPSAKKQIIENGFSAYEAITISDIIIGMTSIMLVEAARSGKPVISLQLGSCLESQLILTRVEAIPYITKESEAVATIERLITDSNYKRDYVNKQNSWGYVEDAASRCMEEIISLLVSHDARNVKFKTKEAP
jgi:hypothetical protein